mmetsp:Transcript_31440/g.57044  ORF Transcript_31440/g.57044 Transcript_31440/m.57044 type:complete len:184 (-) Transcript_31440:32-583(-)
MSAVIRHPPERFGGRGIAQFSVPGILKPRDLDVLSAQRVFQPDRNFKRERPVLPCRGSGDVFGNPDDKLCSRQHREWLNQHYAQRKLHLNPLVCAARRRDRIQEELDTVTYQLNFLVDMDSATIDMLTASEKELKKKLQKASSAPVLRTRPPTPKGQVRHVESFRCQKSSPFFRTAASEVLRA